MVSAWLDVYLLVAVDVVGWWQHSLQLDWQWVQSGLVLVLLQLAAPAGLRTSGSTAVGFSGALHIGSDTASSALRTVELAVLGAGPRTAGSGWEPHWNLLHWWLIATKKIQ